MLLAFAKFHGLVILGVLSAYFLVFRRKENVWLPALVALALGMIAWVNRYPLSKINGMAWQGTSPKTLFLMVRDTAYSFFVSPETAQAQDWLLGVTVVFSLVLLILSIRALIRQPKSVYAIVAYAGILVFISFTFTHVHYQGRLLYPVIPALIANSTARPAMPVGGRLTRRRKQR
jgi:hypothetical protein